MTDCANCQLTFKGKWSSLYTRLLSCEFYFLSFTPLYHPLWWKLMETFFFPSQSSILFHFPSYPAPSFACTYAYSQPHPYTHCEPGVISGVKWLFTHSSKPAYGDLHCIRGRRGRRRCCERWRDELSLLFTGWEVRFDWRDQTWARRGEMFFPPRGFKRNISWTQCYFHLHLPSLGPVCQCFTLGTFVTSLLMPCDPLKGDPCQAARLASSLSLSPWNTLNPDEERTRS